MWALYLTTLCTQKGITTQQDTSLHTFQAELVISFSWAIWLLWDKDCQWHPFLWSLVAAGSEKNPHHWRHRHRRSRPAPLWMWLPWQRGWGLRWRMPCGAFLVLRRPGRDPLIRDHPNMAECWAWQQSLKQAIYRVSNSLEEKRKRGFDLHSCQP